MQKKFLALPLLAGVLSIGALTSCGTPEEWKGKYTYRTASSDSPSTWNVHTWETNTDSMIMGYTELGLVDFVYSNEGGTEHYEVIPEMAASLPTSAALTEEEAELYGYDADTLADGADARVKWVIDLNEAATWENGTPIDADTYLWSMSKMLSPEMKNYRASSYYSGNLALANAEAHYKSGSPTLCMNGTFEENRVDSKVYFSLYETNALFGDGSWYDYFGGYIADYGDSYFPKLKALFADEATYGTPSAPIAVEITSENRAALVEALNEGLSNLYGVPVEDSDDLEVWNSFGNSLFVNCVFNVDFSSVGIKKTGDYQITLYLTKPISDFNLYLSLSSNWIVYQPLYEAGLETVGSLQATNYATSKDTYMSYGPYKLTSYQLDKQILLEKNDAWYGYTDGKHEGQFQTTHIDIQIVPTQAAQLLLFEKGQLDDVALQGSDMDKYRTSSNLLYTPQSYTSKVTFNSKFSALKANQEEAGENINKTVLSNVKFREALSWSLNRLDFAKSMTAGSGVGLAPINNSYVSDETTGTRYRDTEQGKAVIQSVYGDSETGFDFDKAVALFNEAYDEELASTKEGSLKAGDKVSLLWEVYDEDWMDYINYYIDNFEDALAASKFGTNTDGITFEIVTTVDENYSDHLQAGKCEMGMSTWGGATFDPFGILEVYDSANKKYEPGFEGTEVLVDVIIDGEKVTKSFHAWYIALNEGEYALAENSVRVDILAACEEALIRTWNFASIYTRQSVSLLSNKVKYVTEEYNEIYGYGGIRFMTYEYDDYDWVKVSKKLDYTK